MDTLLFHYLMLNLLYFRYVLNKNFCFLHLKNQDYKRCFNVLKNGKIMIVDSTDLLGEVIFVYIFSNSFYKQSKILDYFAVLGRSYTDLLKIFISIYEAQSVVIPNRNFSQIRESTSTRFCLNSKGQPNLVFPEENF